MTGGNKWRNIASRRTGHVQINSVYSFLPVQVVKQNLVRVRFPTGTRFLVCTVCDKSSYRCHLQEVMKQSERLQYKPIFIILKSFAICLFWNFLKHQICMLLKL